MASIMEIMQLCRLCLVKEQVNIPIFEQQGDIRDVFLKIRACLPVKVTKEDKLPKKICDGCSYKLDLLYQFSNTCSNAEKQLLTWLNQMNSETMKEDADVPNQTLASQPQHVKQEMLEVADNGNDTADSEYLLQQQLPFEGSDLPATESHDENGGGDDGGVDDDSSDDEPLAKRRKRLIKSHTDTDPSSGLHSVAHMAVTKTEDASDSDGDDNADDPEPSFVSVGTDDDQQPGPSGLGKASADIPNVKYETEGHEESVFVTAVNYVNDHYKSRKSTQLTCCKHCNKRFKTNLQYLLHIAIHSKTREFKCDKCDYKARTEARRNFEIHMRNHERKDTFKCQVCHQGFPTQNQADEHKYFHTGETPFQCDMCEKSFTYSKQLSTHRALEHVESLRDLLCDFCGKKFNSNGKLVIHRRIHTGEKPHLCSHCPKAFTNKVRLKEHERVHTGERPYKCKFCDKAFSQRSPCTIHERLHKGEKNFHCTACGKAFVSRSILSTHLKNCKGPPLPLKC